MILDIDLGNTGMKWRWLGEKQSYRAAPQAGEVDRLAAAGREVSRVRMASVAKPELTSQVSGWLTERLGVAPQICRVARVCGRVETAYEDESRLGVDRWLAVLAAWQRFERACLVIDAGTAFTIDVVTDTARHCGGYIVPGYQAMLDALWHGTGAVKARAAASVPDLAPALNTGEAVNRGVLQMYLGLIDRTRAGMAGTPLLVLAGGAAPLLLPHLEGARHCPDLVLDGLNIACP